MRLGGKPRLPLPQRQDPRWADHQPCRSPHPPQEASPRDRLSASLAGQQPAHLRVPLSLAANRSVDYPVAHVRPASAVKQQDQEPGYPRHHQWPRHWSRPAIRVAPRALKQARTLIRLERRTCLEAVAPYRSPQQWACRSVMPRYRSSATQYQYPYFPPWAGQRLGPLTVRRQPLRAALAWAGYFPPAEPVAALTLAVSVSPPPLQQTGPDRPALRPQENDLPA